MDDVITAVVDHLDRENPGEMIGLYLYGSAAAGGLRPDSDIDLLLLTRRSLTTAERESLVALLLDLSGWRGHAGRFPAAATRRPVELTAVVVDEDRPWTNRPRRDFQYGEWLREDFVDGRVSQPVDDPNVVVLIATALSNHRVLCGPALRDVVGEVPPDLLRRAVLDVVPALVGEVTGDERNVLLTLARVLVTLETGAIVSKDAAAAVVAPQLDGPDRELMERARAGYLGLIADDWAGRTDAVTALAGTLAAWARQHAP